MKNSIARSSSHNKVLILGAICISIIAGVVSYKIADIKSQQLQQKANRLSGNFDVVGDPTTDKVLSAIDNADQIAEQNSAEEDPFTISEKDTATSRLAKQVYSDYVNQGAGNSDLSVSDIAQNALSQISSGDIPGPKYGLNNILLTNTNNSEDARLYGNNFAEIYMRNMRTVAQDQQKYSNSLSALAGVYENISKELLKIKVPAEISNSHLTIINNYQIIAESFRLIDGQSKDPVKSLLGVKAAKEASDSNDQMFVNISQYFKNNGIIFANNEVGSIWNGN